MCIRDSTWTGDGGSFTAAVGLGPNNVRALALPLAMLGGSYRTGPTTKLVGEFYFSPANPKTPISSVAVRLFGERLSVDFGVIVDSQTFPLLNFKYAF